MAGVQLTDDIISRILDIIKSDRPHVKTLTPATLAAHERVPLPHKISAAERSVLIVHLGDAVDQGHWVCLCSHHNTISIFDSLNYLKNPNDDLQLTSIIQNIFMDVQSVNCVRVSSTQNNTDDCGVFAVAFGVDWALDHDPSSAIYDFPQMRQHLHSLLQSRQLQRFPLGVPSSSFQPIHGNQSPGGTNTTLPSTGLQGSVSTISQRIVHGQSATPSPVVQKAVSLRRGPDKSHSYKSHLWKVFDGVATEVYYTVLVWSSPGWDQKSDYRDYLISRGIKIGKFNRTQNEKLQSKNPKEVWDITLMHHLLQLTGSLANRNDSKWFANTGTDPEVSLTKLKDQRNNVAHTRKIGKEESIAIIRKVRKLTRRIRRGLKWVRRHRPGPIASLPKSVIDKVFRDFLINIDKIRKEQLDFEKKMEIVKERFPYLQTQLRRFTVFSPVTHLLEPFSDCPVEVQDIFTEMIIEEGRGKQKIELGNLLNHLPHDDPDHLLLIKGHAGFGKSTVVRKIISDWLNKTGYIKHLDSFDMIFLAECRHHTDSFRDLIVSYLGDVHKSLSDEDLISTTLEFKCLAIIDGYDELNTNSSKLVQDVLTLKRSRSLSLIFTSRPEAEEKFSNKVKPDFKTITKICLEGIPKESFKDFVGKYHSSITSQSSYQIDGLLKYLEKTKHIMCDTWKSPYNLSILVILWSLDQNVNSITTEAELHMQIFKLQTSKIRERLQRDEYTLALRLSTLQGKLETFLWHLSGEALTGLKNDEIVLSPSTYEKLTRVCNYLNLPAEQLLGAFLKEGTPTSEKHYCFPHKAWQEFFGAYHIILKVCGQTFDSLGGESQATDRSFISRLLDYFKRNVTLRGIFKDLHPEKNPLPEKYQNLLCNIISLSQVSGMNVPDKFLTEALNLLKEAGLRNKDSWVRIMNNIKCNERVANWIANNYGLLEGEITITDFSFDAYLAILKVVKDPLKIKGNPLTKYRFRAVANVASLTIVREKINTKEDPVIDIKLNEVPDEIDDLSEAIITKGIEIRTLDFPELRKGRKTLQRDSQKNGLLLLVQNCPKEYTGVWRSNFRLDKMKTSTERDKRLLVKVDTPWSLCHLFEELQAVHHIFELIIYVDANFESITEDLEVTKGKIKIISLEFHDVKRDDFDNVGRVVREFQRRIKKRLEIIYFRRLCPLDMEGHLALIEILQGVKVRNRINFPSSICPSSSSQEQIIERAKLATGCHTVSWPDWLNE